MSSGISPMTLGYLFRHSRDIRYCEGRHGGVFSGVIAPVLNQEHTEWSSVLTSPFIFFCGLHMLLTWKHDDGLIMLISTLFALNGLAAGLAHLVGTSNWHNVDSHSMLPLWLSFALVGMEISTTSTARLRKSWGASRRAASGCATSWGDPVADHDGDHLDRRDQRRLLRP